MLEVTVPGAHNHATRTLAQPIQIQDGGVEKDLLEPPQKGRIRVRSSRDDQPDRGQIQGQELLLHEQECEQGWDTANETVFWLDDEEMAEAQQLYPGYDLTRFKRCSRCKQPKPRSLKFFYRDVHQTDRLNNRCIPCIRYTQTIAYKKKQAAKLGKQEAPPDPPSPPPKPAPAEKPTPGEETPPAGTMVVY